MLAKPAISEDQLMVRLEAAYGLRVNALVFLPLGADVNTAVYRIDTASGAYFLKLRRGPLDAMSVAIPALLSDTGIKPIIAPLTTTTGQLWSTFDGYTLTLYPFVAGSNGYAMTLSEQQWVEFGAAFRQIHAVRVPPALRRGLPQETYTSHWRDEVRQYQTHMRTGTFEDTVDAELAAIMQANMVEIDALVEGAERFGRQLQRRAGETVVCHADIHAGNLLIDDSGALYIVDWDTVLLAPKERDLMFVGSGLGPDWDKAHTVEWFYQGYGPTEIDPVALAYYRCERIVQDIAAFCEQILSTADGPDRRQGLYYLSQQFEPNGVVEIALRSYQAAEVMQIVTGIDA